MSKIYKILLAILIVSSSSLTVSAQQGYWSSRSDKSGITTDKAVARLSFPKEFKLFDLNAEPLRQQLFSIVGNQARSRSTIISLPNVDGKMEQFEIFESSNFEPALQARFPEIRAYSGRGVTDRFATLKLSISPQGIQTMVFRADKENEFIEPYSQDHTTYAVFRSQRERNALPWTCSTEDQNMFSNINQQIAGRVESNVGELKTMRLAQSVTAEYSNFFGAFNSSQVALVLAAVNATLTRCNGVYEKDLAIHLNLIANTTDVFFYDPNTDPYTFPISNWNNQLQTTLTNIIGEANYDIGHLFGQSGGGGNAGCIGCVCVDNQKGRGITSPADGIPMGDNFDIDYVAHEVGHQMGANHTFSFSNEGTGVQKEVGSGITIMGYAGITSQDVAPHSIDIFHEASIQQIQVNMAGKTCPITTNITANNATPVVGALSNYTIPISTPFALTGSATDANGDPLTYCWEQDDNHGGQTGNNSVAYAAKPVGPNWLSFVPSSSPTRLCPRLSTILAGLQITPPLPGGDAIANIEALSSVSRDLHFRLTVRDNHPYSSTPPLAIGQTQFADMTVTVTNTSGPFQVTTANTAGTSWPAGTTQTVTWDVANTTAAPVSCSNVNILISTDGGNNFSMLVANTANDGTENIVVPGTITTTARLKVESVGNIFFDINNANFSITVPPNGFSFDSPAPVVASCPAPASMQTTLTATYFGTFTGNINLTASGNPGGTTVSFGTNPLTTGTPSTTVVLNGTNTLSAGSYVVTVTGTGSGAPTQTRDITFTINPGAGPAITTQPANQTVCSGSNATFSVVSTGTYQWQLSTNGGTSWSDIGGATSTSYTVTGATPAMSGNQYRCIVTGQCGSTTSSAATLTVNTAPSITAQPQNLALCSGSAASFSVTATGSGLTYQWQVSTDGGTTYNDIAGANAATYNIASTTVGMNNNRYRCVVSGACPPAATSNAAILTVSSSITITSNPSNSTICEATNTSFTVAASGSGLTYQWQVSTNGGGSWSDISNGGVYSGATTATLAITAATPSLNNNQYRCVVSNPPCNPGISTAATLTVNTFPVITVQPQNATVCEGAGNTFSVTATTGVGVLTYQWQSSTDGGTTYSNIVGATTSTLTVPATTAGASGFRYRVMVTAGCGTVTSTGAILTVNTYPVISLSGIPAVICKSDAALTFSGSPAGTFSGTGISGTTFTPSAAGVGAVTVTYTATNAGCTAVKSTVVQVNECADRHLTLDKFPAVFVYPSPNTGHFNIRLNTDLYSKLGMKAFDSRGQLVQSKLFTGLAYGSVMSVDMSHVPNGVYHLYLYNDENGISTKGVSVIINK
ncbi:MAG TPA: zinc-dependent metalloprotease family protein [Chitinophagaceae bacterium]|nr:zinc-dependent metalloprotease family protein [Chitinophagaceae bacterium]